MVDSFKVVGSSGRPQQSGLAHRGRGPARNIPIQLLTAAPHPTHPLGHTALAVFAALLCARRLHTRLQPLHRDDVLQQPHAGGRGGVLALGPGPGQRRAGRDGWPPWLMSHPRSGRQAALLWPARPRLGRRGCQRPHTLRCPPPHSPPSFCPLPTHLRKEPLLRVYAPGDGLVHLHQRVGHDAVLGDQAAQHLVLHAAKAAQQRAVSLPPSQEASLGHGLYSPQKTANMQAPAAPPPWVSFPP